MTSPNIIPQRTISQIDRLMMRYTVPIAVSAGPKSGHHCTAMLFSCGSKRFLFTAAHAVKEAMEHGDALFIPSDKGSPLAHPLPNNFYYSPNRALDVAAYEVDDETASHLCSHDWASLSHFIQEIRGGPAFCATRGIIAAESETWESGDPSPTASLATAVFVSEIVNTPIDREGWNSDLHIAARGNMLWAVNSSGTQRPVPSSLRGLSGSPAIVFTANPYLDTFSISEFQVVGFQSSWFPLNDDEGTAVIKLVRAPLAFCAIASIFPSMREVGKAYGLPL